MAFLHCHDCGWSQDDFWDEGYNPIRSLLNWEKDLLDPKRRDEQFTDDAGFLREHGPITTRELIARELERKAKVIRAMSVCTYEEWQKVRHEWACPECGGRQWDID